MLKKLLKSLGPRQRNIFFSTSLRSSSSSFPVRKDVITAATNASATVGCDLLQVNWSENKDDLSLYHPTWLRFNCQCTECKQPKSNQRILDGSAVPDGLKVSQVQIQNGQLHLHWSTPATVDGEHDGFVSLEWLRAAANEKPAQSLRDYIISEFLFDYDSLIKDNTDRYTLYKMLLTHGSAIVGGMPLSDGTVKEFVEKVFGLPVQRTIYGELFDVVSTPDPINVAYSNAELKPHIDLAYYESPPGLQLLHSLRFDDTVIGGESVLVDGFQAAEELRHLHPEYFRTLSTMPATFEKIHHERDWPVHMRYRRPHIALNNRGMVTAVFWAPQFEGPLFAQMKKMSAYYKAYQIFSRLIDTCPRREFRLQPGQMLVFNNRRMLHGRRAFSEVGTGSRHFQGCYVNIDEFQSQARLMLMQNGWPSAAPHVGNQSY